MNLIFITEARFVKKDSVYYSVDGVFSNRLWKRYLAAFDFVTVGARVVETRENQEKNRIIDDQKVRFIELPSYKGPLEFLKNILPLYRILNSEIHSKNAYIFRVPGMLGSLAAFIAKRKKIPYSVEVVGDPAEVFARNSFHHTFRFLFKWLFTALLKKTVLGADNVLYVTESILQRKYPPKNDIPITNASNVFLDEAAFFSKVKMFNNCLKPIKLLSIGSLAQMYKSPDILLKAVFQLKEQGYLVTLTWLGDGNFKEEMIALSKQLGIMHEVNFVGNLANVNQVRDYIDKADIFVLASRTEGIPRAMLEAMARGLPCIGTQVGGIPEILENEVLVPKNDINRLAEMIKKMIENENFTIEQGKRNFSEAKKYSAEKLDARRVGFYNQAIRISQ